MRFSSFTYLVGQGLHNLKANKMMTFCLYGRVDRLYDFGWRSIFVRR